MNGQTIFPHLCIQGAKDAVEFYKKALGAIEVMVIPHEDGKRLMHAAIDIGGAQVFIHDDFPEYEECHPDKVGAPARIGSTSTTVHINVKDCDTAFKRATDAGAITIMAPHDAFWGDRYAQVVDPFGHSWSFAHTLAKTS
jgi:PhnB protein